VFPFSQSFISNILQLGEFQNCKLLERQVQNRVWFMMVAACVKAYLLVSCLLLLHKLLPMVAGFAELSYWRTHYNTTACASLVWCL